VKCESLIFDGEKIESAERCMSDKGEIQNLQTPKHEMEPLLHYNSG
jgi:hypothetical protein